MPSPKALRAFSLILTAALVAASCTTQASRGEFFGKIEPPAGQVLRYISGSEPESLDPQMSSGQPEARVHMALYEGLVEYHPQTMKEIPAVAERWVVDEDNMEFVFFLRRDARFSNGDPITAHDFAYTFRRGLKPELASRSAYMAYDIKYAQAFNEGGSFVRDPQTGRFVTAEEAAPAGGATVETAGGALTPARDPEALHREELSRKGEDAAPDTEFHKFIHAPARLVVPGDAEAREQAAKSNPRLRPLLAGKEFVPVRAEDIGVEAVDDYTVRITLAQPAPFFVGMLAHQFFRVVPRRAIERHGVHWTRPENIVCSGPFKLVAHRPYNEVVVERNPMYWDVKTVKLDRIVFYPLEEQTTMLNLYKAGDVDATYNHTVPAGWLKSGVRRVKDYMDAPECAIDYYMLNVTKPPMDDVRVRKALSYAIDREALADYRVVVKPLYGFTPEGIFPGYPRPAGTEFNVERARQLLAEAGFRGADGRYDPSKFPVRDVEITYNTTESNRQVAEFIQAQWKQNLGITVPLNNMEWKTFLKARSNLEYKGAARAGWIGDYMDPYTFLSLFLTKEGGDNGTGWYDTKYVKMIKDANREPDPARRFELLAKAEAYLLDAAPVIPLVTNATNWMKKPYVKGMYPNPGTMHAWKFVYIERDQAEWDRGVPDMKSDQLALKE
ncbi:MAG TPA: peptide ABC transporter substrate-binding protein [Pyrinomonadaceae bacterium]|nr:peptide ABC transporter substrate-binding protein [Pyrinomonadaceae bacterium]